MEIFFANSVTIPDQSEGMKTSYPDSIIKSKRVKNAQEYLNFNISPAILNELENQQSQKFFDFKQFKVLSKIQIAFTPGVKIHKRNFLLEPVNYQQLKDHLLEKQFRINMKKYMH